MLFYDWKRLYKHSGGNSRMIITIIETLLRKQNGAVLPKNRWDPLYRYYYKDFSGPNFLINPYYLIRDKNRYTVKEVADYIGLSSFRNYGDYKLLGIKTLDLDLSPLGQDALQKNRLLHVEDNEIYFLYEEYT